MTANGFGLGEVAEIELQMFKLSTNDHRKTKAQ